MNTKTGASPSMNKLVRQDLQEQLEGGIHMEDWEPEHIEAIFREHLALQKALKEVLNAAPQRLRVVREARRLVIK